MMVPIPKQLLDVFFIVNIAISLAVLMVALNAKKPLDFSAFPVVLLFATLFRLGLNVASTRIVLVHGHEGETFAAVVTDLDERGARIQLCDRPVVSRVDAHRVASGDKIQVRLIEADPRKRVLRFERVN